MNDRGGQTKATVGDRILDALGNFADQLKECDSVKDLPKIVTVRRVKLDLRPRPFSADELKQIRIQLGVSQAIFAEFVGVGVSTIQDWEQGRSSVSGLVCRLLGEMVQAPDAWARQIKELAQIDHAGA